MDSTKATQRHPLDELLGVDPRGFDEDELTQVLEPVEPSHTAARGEERGSGQAAVLATPVSSATHALPAYPGSEDARDPLVGTLVDGRYQVLGLLGTGGIGLVYLCQHVLLDKPVALKVLRPEYVSHTDLNERFLIEARAASSIKSPRIVDTLDVGTLPTGAPYFVMEYVEGETLASLLERDGCVDLPRTLEIARQIAEGLCAAHAAGVVHRDLKPENVFLAQQPDGGLFAKLFDFGIAKVAGARKRLTYVGAVFGTPTYMSPEQARGEPVDERADIYALGIMIFEMIAGAVPFDGEDPLAIMAQHVDRPPPALSQVSPVPIPAALEAIVQRCLQKSPADRYASAAELLLALCSINADEPTAVPVALPSRPARGPTLHAHVVPAAPPKRRRGAVMAALFVAALAAVGFTTWDSWKPGGDATSSSRVAFDEPAKKPLSAPGVSRASAAGARDEYREVHFVLSPVDARVYRGEQDLGPMPVSIRVKKGESVAVTVRRRGFSTRKVVVDGDEERVVVGLVKSSEGAAARGTTNKRTQPRTTSSARPSQRNAQ